MENMASEKITSVTMASEKASSGTTEIEILTRDSSHSISDRYPRGKNSSNLISFLLLICSVINALTAGYDGSMLNGLNMLPSYTNYFKLNPVTTGLMTSSVWIGGIIACFGFGWVTDKFGRRLAMFWAAFSLLTAVALQTAAQNMAMFVLARILIGFGMTAAGIAGPIYLAETMPTKWRGWSLAIFNDFFYIGALIAAGVTYKTNQINNTWAWRAPSLCQGLFSLVSIFILPFLPESPRWLLQQDRAEEARSVMALIYADGDELNPVVQEEFVQMVKTFTLEKSEGQQLGWKQAVSTKSNRKRVWLAASTALGACITGNIAIFSYLGMMLDNAGIKDTNTQLEINVILNVWSLAICLVGSFLMDRWGRRPTAILSTIMMTVFLIVLGVLSKVYGKSDYKPGVYAAVAILFLFQGSYALGWTPLMYAYPPEVLHFPIRASGMSIFQLVNNSTMLILLFCMPLALTNIGWKMYEINAGWNVPFIVAVAYTWIETKGKTLEEIDAVIEGRSLETEED